jgi:hypothetical protein
MRLVQRRRAGQPEGEKALVFYFALEAKAGHRLVRYSEAEEMMEKIHAWGLATAEAH